MVKNRTSNKALALSRIYQKRNRYYLYWSTPLLNPKTNKSAKWHSLCHIDDGMLQARILADEILSFNYKKFDSGDMAEHLENFYQYQIKRRLKNKPKDINQIRMFDARNNDILLLNQKIRKVFYEFDVSGVLPKHIGQFLDTKESTPRMAQVYRTYLNDFFKYACRKGLCQFNPVDNITVEAPKKRDAYLSNEDFLKIREAVLVDVNGNEIPSGQMILAFIDLCYLTAQRTTEIRLLKWSQIQENSIYFKPTKTASSSKVDVLIPISNEIKIVLDRVAHYYGKENEYVIHTLKGGVFTASGLRSAWDRACSRVNIVGYTLKDLRPKAITDAAKMGFKLEQISVTAAHSQLRTTSGYIKDKDTPMSEVELEIPKND